MCTVSTDVFSFWCTPREQSRMTGSVWCLVASATDVVEETHMHLEDDFLDFTFYYLFENFITEFAHLSSNVVTISIIFITIIILSRVLLAVFVV